MFFTFSSFIIIKNLFCWTKYILSIQNSFFVEKFYLYFIEKEVFSFFLNKKFWIVLESFNLNTFLNRWVSIRDIESTTGKLKRAMLQFTPGSWTSVRWLDPTCTHMRLVALCQLVIFWQVSELNTFFLKHVYEFPPSHPFVVARLVLVGVIVAPSVR